MFCRITALLIVTSCAVLAYNCPGLSVPQLRYMGMEHEISLIFYHTKWCDKSRTAEIIFDELADLYGDYLFFAKVDCWNLNCNCSKTHDTIVGSGAPKQWPTLIVNYGRYQTSIQYTGDWEKGALLRFISTLMAPLHRVDTIKEIKLLKEGNDAIIMGLFQNFQSVELTRFVSAALQWLETDPENSFRFAVNFGEDPSIQKACGLTGNSTLPHIVMISDKTETSTFNKTKLWTVDDLIMWAQNELKRSFTKVYGYSSPQRLVMRLKKQPTLAIFVNQLQLYNVMRPDLILNDSVCKQTKIPYSTIPNKNFIEIKDFCRSPEYGSLLNMADYFKLNAYLFSYTEIHKAPNINDIQMRTLLDLEMLQKCQQLQPTPTQQISLSKYVQKSVNRLWLESSKDLRPNRTLAVIILNATKHTQLLQSLSIPYTLQRSTAVTFIADAQQESIFLMPQPFTVEKLKYFVKEYLNHNLHAFQRTSSVSSTTTSLHLMQLKEVNALQFLQLVTSPYSNQTTVAFMYSPQCAFCSMMSQILLQVQQLLYHCNDIQFVRLNTLANDLPWQYTMQMSPALLVFPKGRQHESKTFPLHHKANVQNVLAFILAQLQPVDQVRTAVRSCNSLTSNANHLKSCLDYAKSLVMQHISHHLKLWQIYEIERSGILEQLRYFRNLGWSIQQAFKT